MSLSRISVRRRYYPNADDMLAYLRTFARLHELPIRYDTDVVHVARLGDSLHDRHAPFVLLLADGSRVTCTRLVWAGGLEKSVLPGACSARRAPTEHCSVAGR